MKQTLARSGRGMHRQKRCAFTTSMVVITADDTAISTLHRTAARTRTDRQSRPYPICSAGRLSCVVCCLAVPQVRGASHDASKRISAFHQQRNSISGAKLTSTASSPWTTVYACKPKIECIASNVWTSWFVCALTDSADRHASVSMDCLMGRQADACSGL